MRYPFSLRLRRADLHPAGLLFVFHQLHQLVELRRQNNFGTSVLRAGLGRLGRIDRKRFAPPGGYDAARRDLLVLQQQAYDGRRPFGAQVEVVLQLPVLAVRHVVGMAFDHDVDIGILRQNFRQIAHRAGAVRVDLEAARAE